MLASLGILWFWLFPTLTVYPRTSFIFLCLIALLTLNTLELAQQTITLTPVIPIFIPTLIKILRSTQLVLMSIFLHRIRLPTLFIL